MKTIFVDLDNTLAANETCQESGSEFYPSKEIMLLLAKKIYFE